MLNSALIAALRGPQHAGLSDAQAAAVGDVIVSLKAKLTDLGNRHAELMAQARQFQDAAMGVERECLKVQGRIEMLQEEIERAKAEMKAD